MEKNRRKTYDNLEITKAGNANGISTQLEKKLDLFNMERVLSKEYHPNPNLTKYEIEEIIKKASKAYGEFLDALGNDWRNDPNSKDTPMRVAKSYVNDLWKGRYEIFNDITSFPSDGYDGIIIERNIPLVSMCSHHHQTILGVVHIGYVSSKDGRVIGLSKLNRIVELFGRRGAIQEQLTTAIHNAVDTVCEGNKGVIITVVGTHNCVACRGVKHQGASMVTTKASGVFSDNKNLARAEFFNSLKINTGNHSIG